MTRCGIGQHIPAFASTIVSGKLPALSFPVLPCKGLCPEALVGEGKGPQVNLPPRPTTRRFPALPKPYPKPHPPEVIVTLMPPKQKAFCHSAGNVSQQPSV